MVRPSRQVLAAMDDKTNSENVRTREGSLYQCNIAVNIRADTCLHTRTHVCMSVRARSGLKTATLVLFVTIEAQSQFTRVEQILQSICCIRNWYYILRKERNIKLVETSLCA